MTRTTTICPSLSGALLYGGALLLPRPAVLRERFRPRMQGSGIIIKHGSNSGLGKHGPYDGKVIQMTPSGISTGAMTHFDHSLFIFSDGRARRTARARASLQGSLKLATADVRQAPNRPPPRSTLPHCC